MNFLSGDVWTYTRCCCRQPCSTPQIQSYCGYPRSPQTWRGCIGPSAPQNTSGIAWHGTALTEEGPSIPLMGKRHSVDLFKCSYVRFCSGFAHLRNYTMMIQTLCPEMPYELISIHSSNVWKCTTEMYNVNIWSICIQKSHLAQPPL